MKILLLAVFLGVVALLGLSAQDNVVDYAKMLSKAYVRDGVTIESGLAADGTQNLAVLANGGYFPLQVKAKAGVPSTLRVYTDKTYDCSRAFLLPDLKLQAVLPVRGFKAFSIPPQKKGASLFGTCGMGMYTFEILFE